MSAQNVDQMTVLPAQSPDCLQNRQVSLTRTVLLQTLSPTNANSLIRTDTADEGIHQRRFANTCFSCNENHLTLAAKHLLQPVGHLGQRLTASDDSRWRVHNAQ